MPSIGRLPLDRIKITSFFLVFLLCLFSIIYGFLPGLLSACLGYTLTSALSAGRSERYKHLGLRPTMAAAFVIICPIILIIVIISNVKGVLFGAIDQYQALLHHLAGTVLEIREKLPADLAKHLPHEIISAQLWLADYLKSQASALAGAGSSGLHGGLLVYVGLVVGALIRGTDKLATVAPLRFEIRQRALVFVDAFRQIVVAQFWIAAFNAFCTAIFLLVLLPLFDVRIPYTGSLIAFTFFAGLIPIVGNLLCNGVLTLAGVSASPAVGLSCLIFLITIHKAEYVINAKVVGKQTNTATWELLAVMFIGESIFSIPGLVAAPLYYAYIKKELSNIKYI